MATDAPTIVTMDSSDRIMRDLKGKMLKKVIIEKENIEE